MSTPTIDEVTLQLADYCCRCGKMFAQHDPLVLLACSDTDEVQRRLARPAHRDFCTSPEDVVVMTGKWFYGGLLHDPKPQGRR